MPDRPRLTLALLFAAYTLNFVDRTILGVVQQPLKLELGLTDTQLGLLGGTAFALFYSVLGIPVARLAERYNRPHLIAGAIAIWSTMTMLCGAAGGFGQLFLARIGVGIGEAGCTPPSHALIAETFRPARRSTAISIYSLGVPAGILLGAVAGGTVGQFFGWRIAFVLAGAPGILFAIAIWWLVPEPRITSVSVVPPSLRRVLAYLAARRAFLHITAGIVIASFAGYALLAFTASLMVRRFGMGMAEAGIATGLITGCAAGIGTGLGGYLADRLGRRDARFHVAVPAIGLMIATPLLVAGYLATDQVSAIALLAAAAIFQFLYLGPTYGVAQNLTKPDMRATTSAVLLFAVNLIGLGAGPPLLGFVSDRLTATHASADALGLAMAAFALLFLWAAAHYALAARHLRQDLAQTQ